ncbi:hypothetical protein MKW98_021776 [Papaver atlanticum]|uniref:Uncharacterized protein n=1 Tax=Papaver atlanticum TaxID=357466 RepID=A0AAD4X5B5_9MAGN|nr:hypothetical protein MKW98_021776 [Papaver atlanticum]
MSDFDMLSLAIKRLNPEQQTYLNSSGIGSSSAPDSSRTVTAEEFDQWINVYQPAKRFKPDNLEQPVCSPSISSIICTLSTASIGDSSTQTATLAPPADTYY